MLSIDRISTSTNLLCFKRDGRREMIESIPLIASYGYKNIDLNFCELLNPGNRIDDSYIKIVEGYKKELQISYNQSHVPYTQDYLALSEKERNNLDTLIKRAFEYSSVLGVDTIVIHPIRGSIKDNIKYFENVLKIVPSNCRLAIENMERHDEIGRAEELLEIIAPFDKSKVGICLDTGHAHMYGLNISDEIKKLNDSLIATHIADNHKTSDEHFMPYFGSIDWEGVISTLNEIDYKGFLTYEIMFFFKYLPQELQEDVGKLSLKVLEHLISLKKKSSSF